MSTKTCTKCGVEKDVSEFSKNINAKDGLFAWCKSCYKKHYEVNREKIIVKQMERYEAKREEINAKRRTPEARAKQRTPEYRAKKIHREKKDETKTLYVA